MKSDHIQKLIFVYNANSGKRNALMDTVHKVISPSTYECNLCDITFGLFTEKVDWKEFRTNASVEMEFLHKDEFERDYASKFGYKFTFPIVLADAAGQLEILINTEELNALDNVNGLISLVETRLD